MRLSIGRGMVGRAVAVSSVFFATLLPAAGHASSVRSHPGIKMGGILTVSQGPAGSWTANFNAWAPGYGQNGTGMIWEPLLWFNTLKGGKITPWLAQSYKWSNGNKTLTFNLRPGVKWNDGKPFTSQDVLFSYNQAKKYPTATFCNQCFKEMASVKTPNATTIAFTLKKPDSTMLFWIGSGYPIPQHVFANLGDPTKVQVKNPVATGPFMMGSFSPQVFVLKRNPRYWQKGKPYLAGLRYPAYSSNDSNQLALVNGEIEYGGVFIPDAQKVYASKNPNNHFWFPPSGYPVSIFLNNATAPFNNVHVRHAINLAIDRTAISSIAEYGYEPAANGAGILYSYLKKWGDSTAVKAAPAHANVSAAKAELAKAKGVNLSSPITLNVVSGWSDWVTTVQQISQELRAVGMTVNVVPLQFGAYLTNLQQGKFEMAIWGMNSGGNTPYFAYHDNLSSIATAPIGQTTPFTNYGRYKNSKLDSLLTQYGATTSVSKQIGLMKQAERIFATDMPIVPIMYGADWYEYNTKQFTGFPTAQNAYDLPPPWAYNNGNLDVVLHIHLK